MAERVENDKKRKADELAAPTPKKQKAAVGHVHNWRSMPLPPEIVRVYIGEDINTKNPYYYVFRTRNAGWSARVHASLTYLNKMSERDSLPYVHMMLPHFIRPLAVGHPRVIAELGKLYTEFGPDIKKIGFHFRVLDTFECVEGHIKSVMHFVTAF